MAETPTRAGPTLLTTANTSQTIRTASNTWEIIRSIYVVNVTTAEVKVTVGIGTSNTDTNAKRIAYQVPVGVSQTVEIMSNGFIPITSGASDLLYALCDTANGATITLGLITST